YGTSLYNENDFERAKAPIGEALRVAKDLLDGGKADYNARNDLQVFASALSQCDSKTGDLDHAKTVLEEIVVPLTKQLQTIDRNEAENRFREALVQECRAEIAIAERRWDEAEQSLSRCVFCLGKNCESRNNPFEIESYGDNLARLGAVQDHSGRVEDGRRNIEQGLRILYGVREKYRLTGVSNDIARAEQALKECNQTMQNRSQAVTTASN
ncbi:MAG: hypothetical protein JO308_00555, partial [Verrucomicrobia bacterium]|nr:hypothetical protein [Verrucomicrobiota bacterium]